MPDPSTPAGGEPPWAAPAQARIGIVGGRGAVGQSLVRASVQLGCETAVLDLPGAAAPGERSHPPTVCIDVDASNEDSVREAFATLAQRWDRLDHLIFLVGFATVPPRPLRELGAAEWDRVVDGNLRSAYLTITAALPLLDKGRSSSIVVVSSALTLAPQKGYGAYIAAKLGVTGLVKSLALELAPAIRVNAVAPSAMLTPFLSGGSTDPAERAWFDAEAAAAAMPMGRLCTPDDVVGPILFLTSPAARFITGQTLHISGGRVLP